MPHKRAKRSLRTPTISDNAPDSQDNDMPKSMARVLNAQKIRSDWKAKKRSAEDTGKETTLKKRKIENKVSIKPGESLGHFNRRVEDDMRSAVRAATKSSNATTRKAKRTETEQEPRTKNKEAHKEFATAAPKKLNDVAQAPPELKFKPRGKVTNKKEGALSMAQQQMMEMEREKAIARYRQLKAEREGKT